MLTALLGSLLKDRGSQLTMQAQTDGGVVDLLVCDFRDGELRGYVRHDAERLAMLGANPSLYALFGQGYLAITFDLADHQTALSGHRPARRRIAGRGLPEPISPQSEQVPTLIRVGIALDGAGCDRAGGMLVQHLAEGEEGRERLHVRLDHPEWEHVAALAGSTQP